MKDCVTEEIIEETNEETKLGGLLKKMQRMNSPGYLHTVSLNELYENVYESRPPAGRASGKVRVQDKTRRPPHPPDARPGDSPIV